jgi:hypothetical protein
MMQRKFVDISGYGHSGKTAVSDFLRQYSCVFSYPNNIEFELFRVPGGLLDLYYAIYESWNLIRSRVRIKEFRELVKRIGTVPSYRQPATHLNASGHCYDLLFNHRFIELSEAFIEKLISGRQESFWPYDNLRINPVHLAWNKLKYKATKKLVTTEIYYSSRQSFLPLVTAYIQELFDQVAGEEHSHVMLSNAFEPFNPGPCLDMAGDALCIVVDRDPRDIYASLLDSTKKFVPEFERKRNIEKIKQLMTGFGDVHQYISRFKTLKENIVPKDDPRVLRIRYEDFINRHEEEVSRIMSFTGIPADSRSTASFFNLDDSKKNVGLWKNYRDLPEIQLIERELPAFCYQS